MKNLHGKSFVNGYVNKWGQYLALDVCSKFQRIAFVCVVLNVIVMLQETKAQDGVHWTGKYGHVSPLELLVD